MAELKPCPFCGGEAVIRVLMGKEYICPIHKRSCIIKPDTWLQSDLPIKKQIEAWNTRTPKEENPKVTCANCKHLMFSDFYGECNKRLKIVNPRDTCEFAEPKERGGVREQM